MYTYISALSKLLDGDKEWVTTDISNIKINILFQKYSRIILTLHNPFLLSNIEVDFLKLDIDIGLNITIIDFLVINGNKTIPALPGIFNIDTKYAKYADAFHAGYKIEPINSRASLTASLPDSEKTWLRLTKNKVDYDLFHKSCLVNVNGFFHLIDSDINSAYVVDGATSLYKSNHNQIGIYSFKDLGQITYIPIKNEMLYKQLPEQLYKDIVYINSGVNISNKTIILVLGGYIHVLDNKTFTIINDTSIRIDIANLQLLNRYYESKDFIDLSSYNLTVTDRNKEQISIDEFYSDAVIAKYLTLSQSFIVLLDNTDIFVNREFIKTTMLPDMFISYKSPIFPVIVGEGKVTNPWYTEEDGQYSITCTNTIKKNYIFDTIGPMLESSSDSSLISTKPYTLTKAYNLIIGSNTLSY